MPEKITIHDIWGALQSGELDEQISDIRLALDLRESLIGLPIKKGSMVKLDLDWARVRGVEFEVVEILENGTVRLRWPEVWQAGSRKGQEFLVKIEHIKR